MILSEELTPRDVETVLHRLGIEHKGNGWKTIKSPLREEKNASFGINLETGAWRDHANDDTGDIVTLAERVLNKDNTAAIQWIKEQTDLAGALYGPVKSNGHSKPKAKEKPKPFWTDDKINTLSDGQDRLNNSPGHEIVQQIKDYDCLHIETLKYFGAGIWNYWYAPDSKKCDWLAFPYKTGVQLYRRNDVGKVMYAIKGSKPGESFFGSRKATGEKDRLFIAKSPRETMLLHQLYGDRADVVGLATGEQGNLSNPQIEWLRTQISGSTYSDLTIILDCDTENAESTAKGLAKKINDLAEGAAVSYVNLFGGTGGDYKDLTDCTRSGMSDDLLWDLLTNGEEVKDTKDGKDTKASGHSLDDAFDVSTAPPVPTAVYDYLPEILKTRCSLLTKAHRKDVFLISALPVIAAQMPNVLAGHVDGYYTPDLFTLIVAGPGTGKGISSKSKAFGHVLNEKIIEQSKQELADYEQRPDEEKEKLERPQERSLLIAANSSSRGIYDTLDRNGGNGLIFENEITHF